MLMFLCVAFADCILVPGGEMVREGDPKFGEEVEKVWPVGPAGKSHSGPGHAQSLYYDTTVGGNKTDYLMLVRTVQ